MSGLCVPSAVLDQHLVVLGKTGAGKSSVLRHLVEHLLSHKKRVCVVDPKGDWWGLKAAGKRPGFPVIAFGDFKDAAATDVPINAQSGRHVAELVATGNRPCIIGFRGWMTSHMVQFWIDFASGIFNQNAGELFIVGDEFHNFAPKGKIMDPQAGKCLHWSNRLMSEGRGLGIVMLIASQRPQKVHNDTLTSCETLVAMRVVHAADRGAVEDWIKGCGDKEKGQLVLSTLAAMPRGEGYVWSPEAGFGPKLVKFPMFETFDSFAPPQLQKKVKAASWADVDLGAVKEKMAAVIEEAKANDPRELKRQVADLRKRVDELTKTNGELGLMAVEIQATEVPILSEEHLHRLEKFAERMETLLTLQRDHFQEKWVSGMEKLVPVLMLIEKAANPIVNAQSPGPAHGTEFPGAIARSSKPERAVAKSAHGSGAGATGGAGGGEDISAPQQRILDALWSLRALGLLDVDKSNVAVFSDQSPTSSGYGNNLGRLRSMGLIEYPQGGRVRLTAAGVESAGGTLSIRTSEDLHRAWFSKLAAPKVRILEQLIAIYPQSIGKADLAERAGQSPTSSGYGNNLGNLRSLGLIEYPGSGQVVATELLFLPTR